jgi:hypothetical protein
LLTGGVHENAIYVKFVLASSLIKFVGGSGAVVADNFLSLLLGESAFRFPFKHALSYTATFDVGSSFSCHETGPPIFSWMLKAFLKVEACDLS